MSADAFGAFEDAGLDDDDDATGAREELLGAWCARASRAGRTRRRIGARIARSAEKRPRIAKQLCARRRVGFDVGFRFMERCAQSKLVGLAVSRVCSRRASFFFLHARACF